MASARSLALCDFFFSSRRRHTRYWRDWSSDVCSSDLVHIGGHIAFEIEQIAAYCRDHGIFLIEDCAHAHGASWNGRRPGSWGDAGVYSFYATKTVSTGEGGMLVTRDRQLEEFARAFRNYGKIGRAHV